MELCEFHDRLYGKYKSQLFVLEPAWDSFRPIESVAWNGTVFEIQDSTFKKNIFDQNYGYGSLEMKALCRRLLQETELGEAVSIEDPIQFWKWLGVKSAKWWYDRPCVFSSQCVPRNSLGWKRYLRYLNVRAKTLKNKTRMCVTKRLIAK